MVKASTKDVDEYLVAVPGDARAALEKLRAIIRAAAPEAVELISYQVPTFYYLGGLVAFHAAKNHCSFHVMSPSVANAYRNELKSYDMTTATIHFSVDKPIPAEVVKKIVKARIEENEARHSRRKTRGRSLP